MQEFLSLFSKNIKSKYTCFDRVIIKGYLRWMFSADSVINFLKSCGFRHYTNGVMRIFTDQLNAHIAKEASRNNIPLLWWPSVNGGKNGDKLAYVLKHYAKKVKKKGNFGHPSFLVYTFTGKTRKNGA